MSVAVTEVALSGPLFTTERLKTIGSPTLGVGLLDVFVMERSAQTGAETVMPVVADEIQPLEFIAVTE